MYGHFGLDVDMVLVGRSRGSMTWKIIQLLFKFPRCSSPFYCVKFWFSVAGCFISQVRLAQSQTWSTNRFLPNTPGAHKLRAAEWSPYVLSTLCGYLCTSRFPEQWRNVFGAMMKYSISNRAVSRTHLALVAHSISLVLAAYFRCLCSLYWSPLVNSFFLSISYFSSHAMS